MTAGAQPARTEIDPLYSPAEAAQWASVSRRTIYRRIGEGVLPAVRIGPLVRIHQSDLPLLIRVGDLGEHG